MPTEAEEEEVGRNNNDKSDTVTETKQNLCAYMRMPTIIILEQ